MHTIDNMRANHGSTTTFSQLQNLANGHIGNFDSYGDVEFVGGGDGKHTIDNMRGNPGSRTTFSI